MKLTLTCAVLALSALFTTQSTFAQKRTVQPYLLAPVEEPVGDTGGGGGGYTPPAVYGHMIPNGNPGNSFNGFQIILFEGNNATQDVIAGGRISGNTYDTYSGRFRTDIFTKFITNFFANGEVASYADNSPANDETRSLQMCGMQAGRVILVFDSPSADTGDDWTEIIVKKDILGTDRYQIDTYEQSYEDEWVKVTHHHHNGLDGKVSYMKVYTSF